MRSRTVGPTVLPTLPRMQCRAEEFEKRFKNSPLMSDPHLLYDNPLIGRIRVDQAMKRFGLPSQFEQVLPVVVLAFALPLPQTLLQQPQSGATGFGEARRISFGGQRFAFSAS